MSDATKYLYHASNYHKLFGNKPFIDRLITNIKNGLGRQLVATEKQFILNYLTNLNPALLTNKNPNDVLSMMTKQIIEKIAQMPCHDEIINIHEMLKDQIGVAVEDIRVEGNVSDTSFSTQITNNFSNAVDIASLFGSKSLNDLQKIISPATVKKNAYILLDTRYRLLDTDGRTFFKWNFTNNATTSQGSVNFIGDIQNITSVRVYPTKMPYISQADSVYNRITMFIHEFSAQAYNAQENRQFHFMLESTVDSSWIRLNTENTGEGNYYIFRNPIARLDTITVSFASPLQVVTFDLDRRNMLVSAYGAVTTFSALDAHNLTDGDLVFITGFTTANPNLDVNVISGINNLNGVPVQVTSTLAFTVDINTSLLNFTGPGTISVTNGVKDMVGAGTTFLTTFAVNDVIEILGIKYSIILLTSDTQLRVSINYAGTTGAGLTYSKNNTLPGMNPSVYFGSKRMFIPLELEYFANTA